MKQAEIMRDGPKHNAPAKNKRHITVDEILEQRCPITHHEALPCVFNRIEQSLIIRQEFSVEAGGIEERLFGRSQD